MKEPNGHACSFEQLQAFADGALDDALTRAVERHLADCGECRAAVDRLRALAAGIERAESPDAPAGYFDTFNSRVASRIAAAKRPVPLLRKLRLAWWGLVPAAAAAALALVVSLDHEPRTAMRQLVRIPSPAAVKTETADWPTPDEMAAGGDQREQAGTRNDEIAAPAAPAMTSPAAAPPRPEALALSGAADKEETAGGERAMKRAAAKSSPAAAMEYDRAVADAQAAPAAEEKSRPAPPADTAPGTAVAMVPAGPAMIMAAKDAPAPVFEQPPAPREVGEVRVIVIHLPDGASFCPAPEIASAIRIGLSPPARAEARARER
ncbi:MAG: zf-HC2 domain-containing protein [Candidatus Edwardsbacteria bacterium]|jgi:hypothetical protein|nr:zf-HC2 domain-containing protein [Candidatus Edwardsbacteria bacterium]